MHWGDVYLLCANCLQNLVLSNVFVIVNQEKINHSLVHLLFLIAVTVRDVWNKGILLCYSWSSGSTTV
uniref:Ovule protein n=1 Tax=Strongyloides papillosus TaxID=174720 RepID=A0A0N5BJM4_STREA